ncbi:MAG: hypothetical protein R3C32_01745 [Chloroflexota bacterium]
MFTILGIAFLIIGIGLALVPMLPASGSFWDEFRNEGAGIAGITFIPIGIVFTALGLFFGRLTAGRRRLLREGIPGQATILSIEGGNMVINNINYLMTFQLLVSIPGRQPYQVEHKQLVPIFAIASLPIGASVPVMVDRANPDKLTIDLAGEASAMRRRPLPSVPPMARRASPPRSCPTPSPRCAPPPPNTFTPDLPQTAVPLTQPVPLTHPVAVLWQRPVGLAPAGSPATGWAAQAQLLASGRPGSAVVREARRTTRASSSRATRWWSHAST